MKELRHQILFLAGWHHNMIIIVLMNLKKCKTSALYKFYDVSFLFVVKDELFRDKDHDEVINVTFMKYIKNML
jgi:hypothetical protein